MARERFDLNFARTPARNEWKILSLKGVYNSLEDDSATLNNVWDEEHDALNMVTVVCNELDGGRGAFGWLLLRNLSHHGLST